MPLGIGELKSLRTLSKIIVGGENGLAITELNNLKNLRGKISISGLGNVQNPMHAREANLFQKRLSELELDWCNVFNAFQMDSHEKEVLNELRPRNDTLKKLRIVSYRGTDFPNWVGDPLFLRLTHVSIHSCNEFTSLPRLGQLPSLKELFISEMNKVKVVGWELLGTGVAFPSLKILSFDQMLGWEVWSTNSGAFPCLQELRIENCPNLVHVSLEALPSLRVLYLRECSHGVLTCLVHVASSLTKLEIDNISGLTDEMWRGVIEYLGNVEEVKISGCNEISYLWESEAGASKYLVNLRTLEVMGCSKLVSLGEKDCGSNLTSLTSLSLWDCKSMEHFSCPDSVEEMIIQICDSVTSVSFSTGGGKNLKSVTINDCKKLLEEGLLMNSNMLMLEDVDIMCSPNLKSITALGCFVNLTKLAIIGCLGMESFPDHELPNLTSLTCLRIKNCTSLDASFPRGLWPPNLCLLDIGGLKKRISEWGPQKFPISLVDLTLYGGPSEDASNFSQLSHLLPSSLTSLRIYDFEKVESVSMGLQHLTSLQHLSILFCPKTIDLPEMLLPSLLRLEIRRCPNLKERSSKRGSYWPLISRIPFVLIDSDLLR